MNYIELINRFWEIDEAWQFSCCETRLYFYLLKTANRLGWEDNWTHSDDKTSANVGVSRDTLKSARNRLVQAKLISFKAGGKGYGNKTRYEILVPKSIPKSIPNPVPKSIPIPIIDKPNQTKLNITPNGVVELWNFMCVGLSKVERLTDSRKKKVNTRLAEMGESPPEQEQTLRQVFSKVQASSFLNGDNRNQWKATFDWVFENDKNWVKVMEGNYDNEKQDLGIAL